jgi:hypothetical protein
MSRLLTILVIVGLAGGGVWYFFFATPRQKHGAKIAKEVLVSKAKHLPEAASNIKTAGSSSGPVAIQNARTCRENLALIQSSKRKAEQDLAIGAGEVPLSAILKVMQRPTLPRCPDGGDYIIGPVNTDVRCTIGANGTAKPDDDHILKNF